MWISPVCVCVQTTFLHSFSIYRSFHSSDMVFLRCFLMDFSFIINIFIVSILSISEYFLILFRNFISDLEFRLKYFFSFVFVSCLLVYAIITIVWASTQFIHSINIMLMHRSQGKAFFVWCNMMNNPLFIIHLCSYWNICAYTICYEYIDVHIHMLQMSTHTHICAYTHPQSFPSHCCFFSISIRFCLCASIDIVSNLMEEIILGPIDK